MSLCQIGSLARPSRHGISSKKLFFKSTPKMNNNKKLGLRRGPLDHSFNLPYSLEFIFDFWGKSYFSNFHVFFLIPDMWYLIPDIWISGHLDIWISGYLDIWIFGFWWPSPLRTSAWCIPGRGLFFSRIARPWIFGPHFCDFWIFWNKKDAESHQKLAPPSFSP